MYNYILCRGDKFLTTASIRDHLEADINLDGKRIAKYRIQWFKGRWNSQDPSLSDWYYPGKNDVKDSGKNDDVWSPQSFAAGRRQWTLFADHTHEVCYYTLVAEQDSAKPLIVIERPPQGSAWVTAKGSDFLTIENVRKHLESDIRLDGKHIAKYRIQWPSGEWSKWYYPGENDNVNTRKTDSVWNYKSYAAGRRQWTLFADHTHEVCYYEL